MGTIIVWHSGHQGIGVEFIKEEAGTVPDWPWNKVESGNPAYLKITKSGNSYSGYYSPNGELWTLVGSLNASIANPQIGLYAEANNCLGNAPDIVIDFDFFRVKKISEP